MEELRFRLDIRRFMAENLRYQENEPYLEAHKRMVQESDALLTLLSDMATTQYTREKRRRISAQFARYKDARIQYLTLHEHLIAANSTGWEV